MGGVTIDTVSAGDLPSQDRSGPPGVSVGQGKILDPDYRSYPLSSPGTSGRGTESGEAEEVGS